MTDARVSSTGGSRATGRRRLLVQLGGGVVLMALSAPVGHLETAVCRVFLGSWCSDQHLVLPSLRWVGVALLALGIGVVLRAAVRLRGREKTTPASTALFWTLIVGVPCCLWLVSGLQRSNPQSVALHLAGIPDSKSPREVHVQEWWVRTRELGVLQSYVDLFDPYFGTQPPPHEYYHRDLRVTPSPSGGLVVSWDDPWFSLERLRRSRMQVYFYTCPADDRCAKVLATIRPRADAAPTSRTVALRDVTPSCLDTCALEIDVPFAAPLIDITFDHTGLFAGR